MDDTFNIMYHSYLIIFQSTPKQSNGVNLDFRKIVLLLLEALSITNLKLALSLISKLHIKPMITLRGTWVSEC